MRSWDVPIMTAQWVHMWRCRTIRHLARTWLPGSTCLLWNRARRQAIRAEPVLMPEMMCGREEGRFDTLEAALGEVPVHLRAGSILALQEPRLTITQVRLSPLTLLVAFPPLSGKALPGKSCHNALSLQGLSSPPASTSAFACGDLYFDDGSSVQVQTPLPVRSFLTSASPSGYIWRVCAHAYTLCLSSSAPIAQRRQTWTVEYHQQEFRTPRMRICMQTQLQMISACGCLRFARASSSIDQMTTNLPCCSPASAAAGCFHNSRVTRRSWVLGQMPGSYHWLHIAARLHCAEDTSECTAMVELSFAADDESTKCGPQNVLPLLDTLEVVGLPYPLRPVRVKNEPTWEEVRGFSKESSGIHLKWHSTSRKMEVTNLNISFKCPDPIIIVLRSHATDENFE